jgi:hypothetical protein
VSPAASDASTQAASEVVEAALVGINGHYVSIASSDSNAGALDSLQTQQAGCSISRPLSGVHTFGSFPSASLTVTATSAAASAVKRLPSAKGTRTAPAKSVLRPPSSDSTRVACTQQQSQPVTSGQHLTPSSPFAALAYTPVMTDANSHPAATIATIGTQPYSGDAAPLAAPSATVPASDWLQKFQPNRNKARSQPQARGPQQVPLKRGGLKPVRIARRCGAVPVTAGPIAAMDCDEEQAGSIAASDLVPQRPQHQQHQQQHGSVTNPTNLPPDLHISDFSMTDTQLAMDTVNPQCLRMVLDQKEIAQLRAQLEESAQDHRQKHHETTQYLVGIVRQWMRYSEGLDHCNTRQQLSRQELQSNCVLQAEGGLAEHLEALLAETAGRQQQCIAAQASMASQYQEAVASLASSIDSMHCVLQWHSMESEAHHQQVQEMQAQHRDLNCRHTSLQEEVADLTARLEDALRPPLQQSLLHTKGHFEVGCGVQDLEACLSDLGALLTAAARSILEVSPLPSAGVVPVMGVSGGNGDECGFWQDASKSVKEAVVVDWMLRMLENGVWKTGLPCGPVNIKHLFAAGGGVSLWDEGLQEAGLKLHADVARKVVGLLPDVALAAGAGCSNLGGSVAQDGARAACYRDMYLSPATKAFASATGLNTSSSEGIVVKVLQVASAAAIAHPGLVLQLPSRGMMLDSVLHQPQGRRVKVPEGMLWSRGGQKGGQRNGKKVGGGQILCCTCPGLAYAMDGQVLIRARVVVVA